MGEMYERLPKVLVSRGYKLEGESITETNDGEISEEIMAFADQVLGNGQARVAVTADFGMKDFGNGPSGSVTISLSCNQDDATIANVFQTLKDWTRGLARTHFEEMEKEFQQMFFSRHPDKAAGPAPFAP